MWAYHENVPIAVTVWRATSDASDSVASFAKEAADDATTAISENMGSSQVAQETDSHTSAATSEEIGATPKPQEALVADSQKYAGGSPLNRGEIEKWVIEFTNEERVSAGLQPLRHDTAISDIARSHSEDMARLGLMSHDIGGKDPTDRALGAGYDCRAYLPDGSYTYGLSENIFNYPRIREWLIWPNGGRQVSKALGTEEMAVALVQGWMDSPGHRENILDRDARRIGVGIAIQEMSEYGYVSETIYATQNFSACK